jgi:hypothetical protein
MKYNFNLEHWPLVYFCSDKNNEPSFDDDGFEEYKKFYLELLVKCKRNKEKMIIVCNLMDMNNSDKIPMKYLMKHAQFNKEIYKFNKEYVKGLCLLCENKSFKNMINLYFSISKPASPFKICRSFKKGNIFLKEKCEFDFNLYIFQSELDKNYKVNDDYDDNDNDNDIDIDEQNNNSSSFSIKELEMEYLKINSEKELDNELEKEKYSKLV